MIPLITTVNHLLFIILAKLVKFMCYINVGTQLNCDLDKVFFFLLESQLIPTLDKTLKVKF